jgi:predicted RNA-binding Zn-ribbon protein involved in translation (DUF1610 family)
MTRARYCCPSCGKRMSWRQRFKFTSWTGFRKSSPCPHCGKLLIWSKWPWRMINIACISWCLLFISLLFSKIEATKDLINIIFLITALLMLWCVFMIKLEVSDSDEKK